MSIDTRIIKITDIKNIAEGGASEAKAHDTGAFSEDLPVEDAAKEAGAVLKNGGIVAFPTDTVYGLGAIYSDTAALKKVYEAKEREAGKPLSILISDMEQAEALANEIPETARALMEELWPGALTIILPKSGLVPDMIASKQGTVGLRMPKSDTACAIIREAGAPIAAPSANISGKRSSATYADVYADLNGRVDMIIDGGDCPLGVSSTVIDFSKYKPAFLREGTLAAEAAQIIKKGKKRFFFF